MSRLPIVNYKTLNQLLIKLGFSVVRQKGSHVFYRHSDGRITTVPNHQGRDLARPLLREILKEIELTVDNFNEHLQNL